MKRVFWLLTVRQLVCRIAEVSLLGALACGSQLLKLVIEELELGDDYDYIVSAASCVRAV